MMLNQDTSNDSFEPVFELSTLPWYEIKYQQQASVDNFTLVGSATIESNSNNNIKLITGTKGRSEQGTVYFRKLFKTQLEEGLATRIKFVVKCENMGSVDCSWDFFM